MRHFFLRVATTILLLVNAIMTEAKEGYKIEAESLALKHYQVIQTNQSSGIALTEENGCASLVSKMPDGYYDLDICYLAEQKGQSTFSVYLSGTQVISFLSKSLDDQWHMLSEQKWHSPRNLYIKKGSEIRISSRASNPSSAIIDYIVFTPSSRLELKSGKPVSGRKEMKMPKAGRDDITVYPEEYPYSFKNPLKGFRGNSVGHEYGTLIKTYFKWNELEESASDGVDVIKAASNARWKGFPEHNVKAIPRVYLDWPGSNDGYPSDMEKGDYTSNTFKQRALALIRKMGEAWDNDPRVAYVEMGLIGQWGEMEFPDTRDDIKDAIAEQFASSFKNKKVMVRWPNTYGDSKYGFGYYWDSFSHLDQAYCGNNIEAKGDYWKTGVLGGETAFDWGNGDIQPGCCPDTALANAVHRDYIINDIRRLHANHVGWIANYNQKDSVVCKGAEEMQKALGYRFVITRAVYPKTIEPGKPFDIHFGVVNKGSSPFYYNWPVEISLLDPVGKRVVYREICKDIDIRRWMPGEKWDPAAGAYRVPAKEHVATHTMTVSGIPSGEYILALSILDPAGDVPAVRFAIKNYYKGGRHPIGRIGIGCTVESAIAEGFDDIRSDNSLYYASSDDEVSVTLFYDQSIPQVRFAVSDICSALTKKGYSVRSRQLKEADGMTGHKIILSSSRNLGEQAYSIKVTGDKYKTISVTGGDPAGIMYGGLQIAEDITFHNLSGVKDSQEKPYLLTRGMKLNLPMDRRIPTYVGGWNSRSAQKAIPAVWDMDFWKKLIDCQARNRYNLLSVWVHHPFPALVKLEDYPEAVLPNIEGFDGYSNDMDIDQRISFWREVMKYAHDRGMKFMFYNWNVYIDYAKDKYPQLTNSLDNPHTIKYMNACMKALLETYPDLDGFGISAGDGMSSSKEDNNNWTYNAIGKSVGEYLKAHPERQFRLVHRSIFSSPALFDEVYAPLKSIPNLKLTFSFKYAQAHMYSTTTPNWGSQLYDAEKIGLNTWATIRNDDYFYINWGDPDFVRDYMKSLPTRPNLNGMYIGSDGYNPTITYSYKDSKYNGQLEIEKRWYMEMLWGRISYNPDIEDDVFRNMLRVRYPGLNADNLFEAWTLSSRPLPKVTELIMGQWSLDFHWYPEGCWSDPKRCPGFRTIDGFANETSVAKGSSLCDIASSAAGKLNGKTSSYEVADQMQADAEKALSLIKGMKPSVVTDNIRHMAYLSMYYAYKVRGATLKKADRIQEAKHEMGQAYLWWKEYTASMDRTYYPDTFRNVSISPDWKFNDEAVLKEYRDLGGDDVPQFD